MIRTESRHSIGEWGDYDIGAWPVPEAAHGVHAACGGLDRRLAAPTCMTFPEGMEST